LSISRFADQRRGMLYIAVGLTVALVAADLLDLTSRKTARHKLSEP